MIVAGSLSFLILPQLISTKQTFTLSGCCRHIIIFDFAAIDLNVEFQCGDALTAVADRRATKHTPVHPWVNAGGALKPDFISGQT